MTWRNIPGKPNWEYDTNPPNPGGALTALWQTGVDGIRTNSRGEEIYMNCRHKLIHPYQESRANEISKTFWDQYVPSFINAYGDGLAAAYSLRDLNEDGRDVVRVRRSSDNNEKDFTASQISTGEMTNWVNSQTVPPLDIGVETSDGRPSVPDGGTSIGTPSAAYSLRSLGEGQADDIVPSGDTVTPAAGAYVVQVRRSGDDNVRSFTADEIVDETLEDWVNGKQETTLPADVATSAAAYSLRKVRTDYTGNAVQIRRASDNVEVNVAFDSNGEVSASSAITNVTESPDVGDTTATTLGAFIVGNENNLVDFSSGSNNLFSHDDGTTLKFKSYGNTLSRTAYNHLTDSESIGASPSVTSDYSFRLDTRATGGYSAGHGITVQPLVKKYAYSVTFKYYIPEGQPNLIAVYGTPSSPMNVKGAWTEVTVSSSAVQGHKAVLLRSTAHGTTGGLWYIADLRMNLSAFDTHVVTWYDQSGNSNDATQPTTASQPLIAEGGSLLADGIKFDGSDDMLQTGTTVIDQTSAGTISHFGVVAVSYTHLTLPTTPYV